MAVWPLQSAVSALQNIVQAITAATAAIKNAPSLIWAAMVEEPVAFSGTITLDLSEGFNFAIVLTANSVMGNPVNSKPGQSGAIYLTQDATGSRTMTFGTAWYWPLGVAPTLSTAANAVDMITYKVRSPTVIVGTLFLKGLAP
jgi:hypothetical protein